jgi:hypothetical protein
MDLQPFTAIAVLPTFSNDSARTDSVFPFGSAGSWVTFSNLPGEFSDTPKNDLKTETNRETKIHQATPGISLL